MITLIASGSRFFPKVRCHIFFTSKSVDQKGIFTGLSPRILFLFFFSLMGMLLRKEKLIGKRKRKNNTCTTSKCALAASVSEGVFSPPIYYHSLIFLCIVIGLKSEETQAGPSRLCQSWHNGCMRCWAQSSHCVGVPVLSACLCLPQTCVRLDAESWSERTINAKVTP